MRPEEEMILCFVKAGALMRSLTFCIMGAAETSKAFDEFIALALSLIHISEPTRPY